MSTTWKNLHTAPTGRKVTGTDGTVYYVSMGVPSYSDAAPRPFAYVQPGRGLTTDRVAGQAEPTPAEHPNAYARTFGVEPGPEWSVNGRPFADWVRVWTAAEDGRDRYSDRVHVESTSYGSLTDAGRAAVEAWLTSPDALAELFSPENLAELAARDAAAELAAAERAEAEARAAVKSATEARRAAQIANRRASDALARVRSANARALVAASEAAE